MAGFWIVIIYFVFFTHSNSSPISISGASDTVNLSDFCSSYGMNLSTSQSGNVMSNVFSSYTGCSVSNIVNNTFKTTSCETTNVNGTWYWKDLQCPVKMQSSGISQPEFHQPTWRVR
jgi:hypothetical protein